MLNFKNSNKAEVTLSDPSQHHDAWKNHLEPQQTQSDQKVLSNSASQLSTTRISSHVKASLSSAVARANEREGHQHQSNVDVFGKLKTKDFFNIDRFKVFGNSFRI